VASTVVAISATTRAPGRRAGAPERSRACSTRVSFRARCSQKRRCARIHSCVNQSRFRVRSASITPEKKP
jgi:hypothetical protein